MVFCEEHLKITELKKNLKFTLYFPELSLLHMVTKAAPHKINSQDISMRLNMIDSVAALSLLINF